MIKNTPVYVSSVVRNNRFTQRFTHLSTPTVWLEASKNAETKSWNVHAMGTSERCRNNGLQNLTPAFQNNLSDIAGTQILPWMQSQSEHNGYRITSYESNVIASGLTERKALAYLVFFEKRNNNFQPLFKNYVRVDFETVARLAREDSQAQKEIEFTKRFGYRPREKHKKFHPIFNP